MMHWLDVLPEPVARAQSGWERRRRFWRAWRGGLRQCDIGVHERLSNGRISAMVLRVEQEIKSGSLSPIERYFADDRDVRALLTMRWR